MNKTMRICLTFWLSAFCSVLIAQSPHWTTPDPTEYNFSANVVSIISYNDEVLNSNLDSIAFIHEDEVLGLGDALEIAPGEYRYFTTVYSNEPVDTMDIVIYHADTDTVYTVATPLIFGVQNVYGSVDDPAHYKVYERNDAPIYITSIADQETLEGFDFADINLYDYLVQVDEQDVIWSYDDNADLSVSIDNGVLSVSGVAGFSGVSTLTVRATEVLPTLSAGLQSRAASSTGSEANEATVNIDFNVVSIYAEPAWNFIPSQEIVLGETFQPIALHDYEYQHTQPTILYDYVPVVQESFSPQPQPTWVINENLNAPTSMTLVIRADYTPKYQFDHTDDIVAAFIDGEIRGVALPDAHTGLYYLTVSGSTNETQDVTISFYSGLQKKVLNYREGIPYVPHQVMGSPDAPFALDLSPIIPIVTESPVTNGIELSPISIVDDTFTGQMFFDFIAKDPSFPMYLNDTTRTSFCITPDDAVVGVVIRSIDVVNEFCPDGNDASIEVLANCIDCIGTLEYSLNGIHYQSDPSFTFLDGGSYLVYVRDSAFQYCQKSLGVEISQGIIDHPILIDPEIGIETWSEGYTITNSNTTPNDFFGTALDIHDRYAVIGSPQNDNVASNAGTAYTYVREDGILVQQSELVGSDISAGDHFGDAVAMTENYAVVSASGDDTDSADAGATYVFRRDYNSWSEVVKLVASDASENNYFGTSVDIIDKRIAVGAVDSVGGYAGAVYVFDQDAADWTQTDIIQPVDIEIGDRFGADVKLFGDWMIVGAPGADVHTLDDGAVYVYQKVDAEWQEYQILSVEELTNWINFGYSVSIVENRIVVGAPALDNSTDNSGAAYVFELENGTWIQKHKIVLDNVDVMNFGFDVDLTDSRIAVTSPKSFDNTNASYAHMYKIENGNIVMIDEVGKNDDFFYYGDAVAISGKNILVSIESKLDQSNLAYSSTQLYNLPDINESCGLNVVDGPLGIGHCGSTYDGVTTTVFPLSEQGDTTITWTFTDEYNNQYQYDQFIAVTDMEDPILTCIEDITIQLNDGGTTILDVNEVVLSAEDNCGISQLYLQQSEFTCDDVGNYSLLVVAEDYNLNQAKCVVDIEVNAISNIVTNLDDSGDGSLRNTINGVCLGDTIYFDSALDNNDVVLSSEIEITRATTIIGFPDIGVDANNSSRIFNIMPDVLLDIDLLTLKNGVSVEDGGAILNNGNLNLGNVTFSNNKEGTVDKALTNYGNVLIKANTITNVE